jgi:hypothetical protein
MPGKMIFLEGGYLDSKISWYLRCPALAQLIRMIELTAARRYVRGWG